jgi:hypothetical protein
MSGGCLRICLASSRRHSSRHRARFRLAGLGAREPPLPLEAMVVGVQLSKEEWVY